MALTTHPVTPDRWNDLQTVLNDCADSRSCQCAWPVITSAQWRSTRPGQRRDRLHDEIDAISSSPNTCLPPGILAYLDSEPVGWTRVGPRIGQLRIMNSRIVKSGSPEPAESGDVWAVTCFTVRRAFRARGITSVLIEAAVRYALDHGADSIEGYPIDNAMPTHQGETSFVGTRTTFERAGFSVVSHPTPARVVVALRFSKP